MPAYYNGFLQVTMADAALKKIKKIRILADEVDINCEVPNLWSDWILADRPKLPGSYWTTYSRTIPNHPLSGDSAMKLIGLGAAHFTSSILSIIALVMLFFALIKRKAVHRFFAYCLIAPVRKQCENSSYFIIGILITAISLIFLESRYSFFFVRDDNFDQFLPVIEKGAHALFANGTLSTWNPCQYMGVPTTSLGLYALTYPITYISYEIADCLMHNRHLTIEIFAFIHLLAGYVVTYFLLRELNVRPSVSTLGALSFVLSGFFLIAGSAWYYVLPVAVWAPLMVLLINRFLRRTIGLPWTIGMGLVIGFFFHAGNAQMWFYAIVTCSLGLSIALLSGLINIKRMAAMLPAFLVGLGIAAPLLLVQLDETAQSLRSSIPDFFAGISWFNLFAPVQNLFANQAAPLQVRSNEEVYYFGGIFALLTISAFWYVALRLLLTQKSLPLVKLFLKRNIWLMPAIFSLAMAAGYDGLLWNVLSCMPLFSIFRQSDKFLVYFALFGIITAAVIIERLLNSKMMPKFTEAGLYGSTISLLCVHIIFCTSSFYNFADKPYPALPDGAQKLLSAGAENDLPQRLMSCSPERDRYPGYPASLTLNFPTIYDLLALEGYEPLIIMTPKMTELIQNIDKHPLLIAQEYGVKFLVSYKARPNEALTAINDSEILEDEMISPRYVSWMENILPESRLLQSLPNGAIYEIPNPKPLAFDLAKPDEPLPIKVSDNGIKIDISKIHSQSSIVVNFQYRPMFSATIDGSPTALVCDSYNRIVVPVSKNSKLLKLEYNVPWNKGLLLGGLLILLGIISSRIKVDKNVVHRSSNQFH
jgi:hypothetical protein